MTRREGLDAVLLAEGPEAADLYRFYGERRHLNLRRFVKLAALSLRRGGVAQSLAAPRRGLRQRANPARGNLPALLSERARSALFLADWLAARVMRLLSVRRLSVATPTLRAGLWRALLASRSLLVPVYR